MGATTNDLFGAAITAEPATPGSYGEAPAGYRLPDATRLGEVRLQVVDAAQAEDAALPRRVGRLEHRR